MGDKFTVSAAMRRNMVQVQQFLLDAPSASVKFWPMGGHIITVAQQKGGSGKTTVAVHLAVAAMLDGKTVALIDSDPQGSLGRWFMTRLEAQNGEPGPLSLSTASAWGISYECGKLKADHDFVIVDTPPKIDADLRPALRESDLVIVPVSASQVDLWATDSVIDLADREDVPALAVLNRVRKGTKLSEQMTKDIGKLDCAVAKAQISNRVVYAESIGRGSSAQETQKTGPASEEITALYKAIKRKLKS